MFFIMSIVSFKTSKRHITLLGRTLFWHLFASFIKKTSNTNIGYTYDILGITTKFWNSSFLIKQRWISRLSINYHLLINILIYVNQGSTAPCFCWYKTLSLIWINQYWTGLKCVSFIEKPNCTKYQHMTLLLLMWQLLNFKVIETISFSLNTNLFYSCHRNQWLLIALSL